MENNNESKNVKKLNKGKITLIVILVITILGFATNAFAGLMGFDNIFFLIKDLVKPTEIISKDELFEDEELLISYSTIGICEGYDVQINSLITHEEGAEFESELKATFILKDKEKLLSSEVFARIYDEEENLIGADILLNFDATREVIIPMERRVKNDEKLKINFGYQIENGVQKTVFLDLPNQEILVEGEEVIEKQSQVEMKRYIEAFLLENEMEVPNALTDRNATIAYNLIKNVDAIRMYKNSNKVTEGKIYTDLILNGYGLKESEVMEYKGETRIKPAYNSSVVFDEKNDTYVVSEKILEKCPVIRVLDITDIKYKNGKYEVSVQYVKYSKEDEKNGINIENLAIYKNKLEFSLNRNESLAKYKLLFCGDGRVVEEAKSQTNTNVNTEKTEVKNDITLEDVVGTYKFVTAEKNGEQVSLTEAVGGKNGELCLTDKQGGYIQLHEDAEKEWGTFVFGKNPMQLVNTFVDDDIKVLADKDGVEFEYNGYVIFAEK